MCNSLKRPHSKDLQLITTLQLAEAISAQLRTKWSRFYAPPSSDLFVFKLQKSAHLVFQHRFISPWNSVNTGSSPWNKLDEEEGGLWVTQQPLRGGTGNFYQMMSRGMTCGRTQLSAVWGNKGDSKFLVTGWELWLELLWSKLGWIQLSSITNGWKNIVFIIKH